MAPPPAHACWPQRPLWPSDDPAPALPLKQRAVCMEWAVGMSHWVALAPPQQRTPPPPPEHPETPAPRPPAADAHGGGTTTGEQVLDRLSFADSCVKDTLVAQGRVTLFYYWLTLCILKAKRPKYQPLLPPPALAAAEGE